MRCLQNVKPTPEQFRIVSRNRPGVEVIRGAAGSGKTTTALLRLKSLIGVFRSRRAREGSSKPIKILILTYNRTLRGYINELTTNQVGSQSDLDLTVSTFGLWAHGLSNKPMICGYKKKIDVITNLGLSVSLPSDFLVDEVDYLMGRFRLDDLYSYVDARRDGRGITPRVEKSLRIEILDTVVRPYIEWLRRNDLVDWSEVAMSIADDLPPQNYDIIVCDESQDFTANQIRAIKHHAAETSSITFVVDTAQRIYARGYTWIETGITVRPENSFRLAVNYRNTQQIAALAASLVQGIPVDEDFTLPDFRATERQGIKPLVLEGSYSQQVAYAIHYIKNNVDLNSKTVAFLHPKGWDWFSYLRSILNSNKLGFVDIARLDSWPKGNENIALSTLHSAKGLEFDHVIILGLNDECMLDWNDDTDHRYILSRKLLAMGISRAKDSVIIGYKPDERSEIISLLSSDTYDLKVL